jgi:hypothetical protein
MNKFRILIQRRIIEYAPKSQSKAPWMIGLSINVFKNFIKI